MRKETLIRHQSVSNDLKRDWKRDWRWTWAPVPDLSRTITFARRSFRERLAGITSALGLLLAPAGLLAFMAYLYTVTGNAFAFADVQAAWKERWGFFLQPLFAFLISPFALSEGCNFRLLNFAAAVTALICGYVMIKRHESARAFYTFISVIIPLSTVTLEAHARYAIALFPVFIILAVVGRSPLVDQVIRGILTVLLTLMTTFFCFFFGLALI